MAVLVGVCSGSAAVVLNRLIAFLQSFSESLMPGKGGFSVGFVLLPAIGMLLSLLLLTFAVRDNIGHGVTKVLKAISSRESRIKPHNMWSSILTSAVTIGFGGSVGAEAPIVYTGAAIGSNIGRKAGLNFRSVTILVGCGAAGAVAGIFKAPLAGVLFTLEVLMFNISVTSMMPLLVSTVSATVISYIFLGDTPFFQCSIPSFENSDLPSVLFLGVFCGLVSLYFQKSTLALEDRLARLKNPWIRWAACGAGL
ncbi:MAG: chloride channel protein, partial [Bacteroidales bacterium]|nr:chloride channel protein [Bacteroidales bacterium]